MTDNELIAYFRSHSRTELHLFSREQVERMAKLAGREIEPDVYAFIGVDRYLADELCDAAERRMQRRRYGDEHPDYEMPHREES